MGPHMSQLTAAQLAVLKADMLANTDPDMTSERDAGSDAGVANWYNRTASPTFTVWRSSVGSSEILNAITWSGTGGMIARSQGERDALALMLSRGTVEPWRANIRQGFADVFSGAAQAAVDSRSNVTAVCKRSATYIEKLFATGTGSDASPATLLFEGELRPETVSEARMS